MQIRFCSIILFVSIIVLITGCTTWNGISRTEKPGTYYVTTNTNKFFGTRPGVLECTSDEKGNLKCKHIEVEEVWE